MTPELQRAIEEVRGVAERKREERMTTYTLPEILQRLRDESESKDLMSLYVATRARLLAVCDALELAADELNACHAHGIITEITQKLAAALKL